MNSFDRIMQILIDSLAIHRRRDVLIKPVFFVLGIGLLVFTVENSVVPVADRKPLPELIPIILPGGIFLAGIFFTTITYLDRIKGQMARLASIDDLTQLPNRRTFLEKLSHKIETGDLGFLMILDLDHFKRINDNFGHAAGDVCLQLFAERLQTIARPTDHYGRLGGEEFGFFYADPDQQHLAMLADQLLEPLAADLTYLGYHQTISVTASIGAVRIARSQPLEKIFHRADLALYRAKALGRAQMVVWSSGLEPSQPIEQECG